MSKRILLVDDAPIIRLILSDILKSAGFEIVGEANNGNEGIEKFKDLKPDLVTLDIVMPEKDGIETLEALLKIEPQAKIVMVTAIDQKESLMKAIKLGASDYIVKPFEDSRVIGAVKKALSLD